MSYPELANKIVLVTGASRGIGREIALEFARQGSTVAANYNTSLQSASQLKEQHNVELFKADVAKREQVNSLLESVAAKFGGLDVLVNNAGVSGTMPIDQYDSEKVEKMWDINYRSTVYATIAALPHLKKSRGCIINIASNAGIGTDTPTGPVTYYAVSKAAVIMFTKRSAFEFGKFGIRVNAIAPGWVETDMTKGGRDQEELERVKTNIRARTFLNMIGYPKHISKVATFLASEGAEFISGQIIVADGGRTDNLTHSV